MKQLFLLPLLGVLLICNPALAQNGVIFQYKINSSEGGTGTVKGYYADGSFRSEVAITMPQMPNGGINMVSFVQKDKPTTSIQLNDKNKTYTEREIKERPDTSKGAEATVKILGNEKIGKYNCIHSQVTQNNHVSEFWMTREIPEYEKYSSVHRGSRYMGRGNTMAALKNANADGFLVKTFSKDMRGVETSVELESFESGTVSADKFVIPDGYTKAAAPEKGAGAGPGGVDYNKLKDMTPEERQKFIDNLKKQQGGGN